MKTHVKFLFFAALLGLLTNCAKDEIFDQSANDLKSGIPPEVNKAQGLDHDRFIVMDELNLKVHYRIIGKGPVDIVFIPAWTNPLTVYTKQFDYFRDKARCIYIDLPGHGLSDAPEGIEYDLQLQSDAIFQVLKKEGVHRFVAVGAQTAYMILGKFERQHPGRITQLVAINYFSVFPWPTTEPERSARITKYQGTCQMYLNYTDAQKLAQLNVIMPPATSPADLLEWGQYFLKYPTWLLGNMMVHFLSEESCTPVPWNIPIMLINTWQPPADRVYLYFPNCDIKLLPHKGTVVQWYSHEDVNALIDEFIDRPGKKY